MKLLDRAQKIEVFTGAGMSADSGIATFRDPDTGLWENVDPIAMASIDSWAKDPQTMWEWYLYRADLVTEAEPNAGHIAIASDPRVSVTTQNIDDLHERAGSTNVIHLHGSLFAYRCSMCARPWRGPVSKEAPPTCPLCENLVRPGVVWFGEGLPQREWGEAEKRMREADAVVIVGTSGVVFPAAGLPLIAHERGVPIIEVSPKPTDLTAYATEFIQGTAAEVLPTLLGSQQHD